MTRWPSLCLPLVVAVGAAAAIADGMAEGREIFVNIETGDDANLGTAAEPLATAQRAVNVATSGDTIHLLPESALYRQMIALRGKSGITIDGHGVTLTGADPLPSEGWEPLGDRLHRRRVKTVRVGRRPRHLLIVGGRAERMGRSPTVRPDFPDPNKLGEGQFSWQEIDEQEGWLYVRGDVEGLEWSVRPAGLLTTGRNRDVTVRNLNARHALNDGFNVHGDARGMRFSHVTGYENYDEGFSAHDTCQCWIEDGRFWGNDNAAYDVNTADTYYRRCEFRESVSVEVGFAGGEHLLDECLIVAAGPVAFRLGPGTRPDEPGDKPPATCRLAGVEIRSADASPRAVEIQNDVAADLIDCTLAGVELRLGKSQVKCENTTLDGRPWQAPAIGP
ncbi:MAG TPA: hypothetical protein VMY37_18325 [Thermoguttaceae bacterium]|nr:hypothetical protein [Thermoguttaceae bacterium]